MASRRFKQFRYSLETAVTDLFMQVSFGASGAPTLVSLNPQTNQGVVSISRVSAGRYTITLQDPYVRIMRIAHTTVSSTGTSTAPSLGLITDNVASISSPTLTVQFSAAGVAADPSSGESALMHITLKNSSVM